MKTKDKKFQELKRIIEDEYAHQTNEEWWPTGRKRTMKWGTLQAVKIHTLKHVLRMVEFVESQ